MPLLLSFSILTGRRLSATWKKFMELLNVPDEGLDTPVGVRPHANSESANKKKLMPFLVQKTLPNKKQVWVLNPFLDIDTSPSYL